MAKKTGKEIVDALTRQITRARDDAMKLDFRDSAGDFDRTGTTMHTLITMRRLAMVLRRLINDLSPPDRPARRLRKNRTDEPSVPG